MKCMRVLSNNEQYFQNIAQNHLFNLLLLLPSNYPVDAIRTLHLETTGPHVIKRVITIHLKGVPI